MKISTSPGPATFTPKEVSIVVESQNEADAIYALFSTACISQAVCEVFGVTLPYGGINMHIENSHPCTSLTESLRRKLGKAQ